jgi:hypothetical protein
MDYIENKRIMGKHIQTNNPLHNNDWRGTHRQQGDLIWLNFLILEKRQVGLCDLHAVCVSVYSQY